MKTSLFKHLLLCCILFLSNNLYSQTSGKVLPNVTENPIWFNNGSAGIGTSSPYTTLQVNGITTLGSGNVLYPASTSLLRFPATGTAGQQRVYIELQGVHNNDAANENGGAFIKFRTSTSAGYGPEIGGIRRSGGTGDFIIKTGGGNVTERLRVLDNGYIGIGTSSPSEKLEVKGKILADQEISSNFAFALKTIEGQWKAAMFYSENYEDRGALIIKSGYAYNSNSSIAFQPGGDYAKRAVLDKDGNFSLMGNLNVDNGILFAKEIQVRAQTADFVFENDYNLRSLEEVESFILENKHLPEIPNAAQMEAEGTNLAEMNKLLLMKIEELTLYMIEQQKMINELKGVVSKQ